MYRWLSTRRQLVYRVAHRFTEVVQRLSAHSPFKGFANIGARQPEIDIILFVGHRILATREPGTSHQGGKGVYPDHGEQECYGAEDGVYWCGARGFLHDVQAIDGHIQCGDSFAALLSLGLVCHGRDAR